MPLIGHSANGPHFLRMHKILYTFFKYGPFPVSFWIFYFFLGSLFILQLTNIDDNGDRKQERRVKSMQHSIPHSLEKAQRPARID